MIGLCVPADEPVGPGDRFIAGELAELKATVVAVVTKTDLVEQGSSSPSSCWPSASWATSPTSCRSARSSGDQLDVLVDVMIGHLPPSPQLYPDDMITDEPEQVLVAELIREAALEGVRDELPHSIAVVVEEMIPDEDERPDRRSTPTSTSSGTSQKAIVIGAGGSRLQATSAPRPGAQIEELLGTPGLPRPARPGRQGVAARPEDSCARLGF